MYHAVSIYDTSSGDFIGYGIRKDGAIKLQDSNYYTESEEREFQERLNTLNGSQEIMAAWPDANDPDVQALLNDESFEPITPIEAQIIDEENSYIVEDEEGEIDRLASVIIMKQAMIQPPSAIVARTKAACERVARERAHVQA